MTISTFVNLEYAIIPIYFTAGIGVVRYINSKGTSIIDMLEENGIGAKGQGITLFFLTLTWPIWAIIHIHSIFNYYMSDNEVEIDNE